MALEPDIRREWLLDPELRFLNHGSFGATPRRILSVQRGWQDRMERDPVRFFIDDLLGLLRTAIEPLATFVGARPEDMVFVENATSGVNAVVGSLQFERDDEIVTTSHVYGAVAHTLAHHAARWGARVVHARVPFPIAGPDDVVEPVREALSPRTRLLVVDHVTSFSGVVYPLERLVALAREQGIPVLVDGAHAPGMIPLDLEALGADWYTGNCHKWLFTPKGCALLWARRDRQQIQAPVISWGWQRPWPASFDWTATRDPSASLCMPDALAFVQELGFERIRAHNRALVEEAAALLSEAWETPLPCPSEMRGFMAAIRDPRSRTGTEAEAKQLRLDLYADGVQVPVTAWNGVCWLRISAQVYNDLTEYRALARSVTNRRS